MVLVLRFQVSGDNACHSSFNEGGRGCCQLLKFMAQGTHRKRSRFRLSAFPYNEGRTRKATGQTYTSTLLKGDGHDIN